MNRPKFLFLFSDTGGGHRSAAEAVREAMEDLAGDSVQVDLVDFLQDYAPLPFSKLPELYPSLAQRRRSWAFFYRLSNGPRRVRSIGRLAWPYVRSAADRIFQAHPADLVVSFHPIANDPAVRGLRRLPPRERPRFVTVVTDLVSTHAFWYHPAADLTIVPTEPAARHAAACGLSPDRVIEVGLPVAARFCRPPGDPGQLRAALGWPAGRKMVLLVGGGDGIGPIEETARAIAASGLPTGLAVVTGRNKSLRQRLEVRDWEIPTRVYGFVRNMPDLMTAADVLVTKAGPGTITEGLNAGLPTILYSFLAGQEAGNVPFLTDRGAGIWAPTPEKVVAGLRLWLDDPEAYESARAAARTLARPHAAREIASLLAGLASVKNGKKSGVSMGKTRTHT
jgi:1,2-diacylglycerol 3-beta-galactosyltransferase